MWKDVIVEKGRSFLTVKIHLGDPTLSASQVESLLKVGLIDKEKFEVDDGDIWYCYRKPIGEDQWPTSLEINSERAVQSTYIGGILDELKSLKKKVEAATLIWGDEIPL